MSARENVQESNVVHGQFGLKHAGLSTIWPVAKIGAVVLVMYMALNTPWVQKYVEDLSTNQAAVNFGHMALASLLIAIGAGWFLTRLSSLSKGAKMGIWVAIAITLVGVNAWWLRGVYENSINGSNSFTAALNAFAIGATVAVVIVAIQFIRRIIQPTD